MLFGGRRFPWIGRRPPLVLAVRLEGAIGRMGLARRGMTAASVLPALARAFATRGVSAVAIVVNSPGGAAAQSELIGGRIRALAEQKRVPALAFVEDVAASGGYWIASAADEIYCAETSIVGSIGVVSAGFGFAALIERFGIERRLHTVGEHKARLDPFRPERAEDVERLKMLQVEIHETFTRHVRARRAGKLAGDEALLFGGDVWTGRAALALGLVDAIGSLAEVARRKFGPRVLVREIAFGQTLRQRLGLGPAREEAAWAAALGALDERLLWSRYGL